MPAEDLTNAVERRARQELQRPLDQAEEYLDRHRRLSKVARVGRAVLREQAAERVGLAASGAAFWLVISALPAVVAAVSLYGLVVSPRRVATDLGHLANGVPGSIGPLLGDQLRRVAATDHAHLSAGLVLSLVLAVWSASAGFYQLDRAIRVAYGLAPQGYLDVRWRTLLGTLATVVLLGVAALLTPLVVGRSSVLLDVAGVAAAIVVPTAGVAALYRYAVSTPVGLRALLPGALLSAAGIVLVTTGFGAYVSSSTHYSAVYGTFAGAVIGMLAVYLIVYVVLLGAVLNAQLAADPSRDGAGRPGSAATEP